MRKAIFKILVTGGAGFIGSAFVRQAVRQGYKIAVIDKLTYAGDLARLQEVKGKYKFYKADICSKRIIDLIFKKEKPHIMVHCAAETHVDRSIRDAAVFIKTNVIGTENLLDIAREHKLKRFVHISTDEVYGEIEKGKFHEDSPLKPNSPYAASKAAADLLIRSYIRTYDFPALIIRPSNNYGPWQYPEKLIPLAVSRILSGKIIPVYGDGSNIREWLFVEDCAKGILAILEKGKDSEIYNLGSRQEKKNIQIVRMLFGLLKKNTNSIEFVRDRPGHDLRYSLNSAKVLREINWRPRLDFVRGLKITVDWCLKHKEWLLGKGA